MRVPYAEAVYGPEEIEAVVEVLETSAPALMTGPRVATFEDAVVALAGKTNGLMVNSGLSSRATSCGNRGFADIRRCEDESGCPNADWVMASGLLLGCHQGRGVSEMEHVADAFAAFVKSM